MVFGDVEALAKVLVTTIESFVLARTPLMAQGSSIEWTEATWNGLCTRTLRERPSAGVRSPGTPADHRSRLTSRRSRCDRPAIPASTAPALGPDGEVARNPSQEPQNTLSMIIL